MTTASLRGTGDRDLHLLEHQSPRQLQVLITRSHNVGHFIKFAGFWVRFSSEVGRSSCVSASHKGTNAPRKYSKKKTHLRWTSGPPARYAPVRHTEQLAPLRRTLIRQGARTRSKPAVHYQPSISLSSENTISFRGTTKNPFPRLSSRLLFFSLRPLPQSIFSKGIQTVRVQHAH